MPKPTKYAPSEYAGKPNKKQSDTSALHTDILLQPDAAAALDALVQAGYAGSATAVIARALIDAHDWLAGGRTEQLIDPRSKD